MMKIALCLLFIAVAIQAAPQYKDNRNVPTEKNQNDRNRGGVSLDVKNERGQGTRVRVDGRQEIFNTNQGRTRGEAYGHWDRTYGGSNHGDRSHGGGVRFEHNWG